MRGGVVNLSAFCARVSNREEMGASLLRKLGPSASPDRWVPARGRVPDGKRPGPDVSALPAGNPRKCRNRHAIAAIPPLPACRRRALAAHARRYCGVGRREKWPASLKRRDLSPPSAPRAAVPRGHGGEDRDPAPEGHPRDRGVHRPLHPPPDPASLLRRPTGDPACPTALPSSARLASHAVA